MERKEVPRVESVHRALTLLRMLIDEPSVGVTEAALTLGVNASTAQRLLATLVGDGFASQRADRRYVVGPVLQNPLLVSPVPAIADSLRPALENLHARTGETVHLATLVGTRIQHVDGIEAAPRASHFALRVGVWMPAHVASGGKVLLAELSDEEVLARYRVASPELREHYPDIDFLALMEELDDVRETRVAWNFGQTEPGVAAISIAVGTPTSGRAALSVAVPIERYTREAGERWVQDLMAVADAAHGTHRG